MNITLTSNVSANGKVLLSDNTEYRLPPEVIAMNIDDINKAGNLVMGRKSFENFERAFGGIAKIRQALPEVTFVWLSTSAQSTDDHFVANTPQAAIQYLSAKGFDNILIGGGPETYDTFLASNLITDMILYVTPVITSGSALGASEPAILDLKLVEYKPVGNDVMRLHYRKA